MRLLPTFPILLLLTGHALAGSLEQALIADAQDGKLDQWTLPQAAFIASGCNKQTELDRFTKQFSKMQQRIASVPAGQRSHARLVQEMHSVFLRGEFKQHCNDLRTTLTTGNYNCVTSTALYLCLSSSWNLSCTALSRPRHVLVGTKSGQEIETTNPAAQPTPARSTNRSLSRIELLGKFFYNRGITHYHGLRYPEALRLFQCSRMLDDSDPLALQNLLATYNAQAMANCDRGNYRQAAQWIEQGLQVRPEHTALHVNDLHIRYHWASHLAGQRKFVSALKVIQQARSTKSHHAINIQLILYRDWAIHEFSQGNLSNGHNALSIMFKRFPRNPQIAGIREQAIRTAANQLKRAQQGQQAKKLLQLLKARPASEQTGLSL